MNTFFEIAPGIVFVVVYWLPMTDIYHATIALMVAVAIQFILFLLFKKKITKIMWVILVVSIISGTLTVALQNPMFVMWKPTVVSWMMSAILLTNYFFSKKSVLEWLFGEGEFKLPKHLWRLQTLVLGLGTGLSGLVNVVVAYGYSEEIWVLYRTLSLFIWPLLFALIMGVILFVQMQRK